MPKLIIEGLHCLKGEMVVQGSKNSILPILAATIMCKGECVIHNCPRISDVFVTIKILEYLGCKVCFEKNCCKFANELSKPYSICLKN